jgi:hypothetical protein
VSLFGGCHAPRPRPLARIWAAAAVVRLSGGETMLSQVFSQIRAGLTLSFPSRSCRATPGAVEVPGAPSPLRSAAAPTFFFPPRRCATHPVSVRPRGSARRLPLLLLELTPPVPPHLVPRLDAGGRATASVPSAETASRAPSASRRHGLAGPPWSWQPGPVPIRPGELSGPPTREHHRPWAECEAQYCAVV